MTLDYHGPRVESTETKLALVGLKNTFESSVTDQNEIWGRQGFSQLGHPVLQLDEVLLREALGVMQHPDERSALADFDPATLKTFHNLDKNVGVSL